METSNTRMPRRSQKFVPTKEFFHFTVVALPSKGSSLKKHKMIHRKKHQCRTKLSKEKHMCKHRATKTKHRVQPYHLLLRITRFTEDQVRETENTARARIHVDT